MGQGQKLKIDHILEWLDKSDYYQILNIPREANSQQIKESYFKLSQQYHPDRYFSSVEKSIQMKFTQAFKRINEAYLVLKNHHKRKRYDEKAFGEERAKNLRYQRSEEDRSGPVNPEDFAKTTNGKKYLKLALVAQRKKDWRTVEMNLNFAIGYEPDNEFMKKMMETALIEIKNLPKIDPFKIR
jgi:curved DNA-binding protein CbpA